MNCTSSPTGDHGYNPHQYERDDQGFYLECVYCGHTEFFACDTVYELYELFAMNDDND